MRIAVIAASGRSGRAFVQEALADGHTIHAGIRGENPFEQDDNLKVFQCDATNVSEVTKLIEHCDAVVSLIGHVKGSDSFVQTKAITAIAHAMEVAGIKRLVSLTGTGVWVKGDGFKHGLSILNTISRWFGVKRFDDGVAHAAVLEKTNLDWTIVRVLLLTDGEPGRFSLKPHGMAKVPTPRREVATAILRVLHDDSFIREYPVIRRP